MPAMDQPEPAGGAPSGGLPHFESAHLPPVQGVQGMPVMPAMPLVAAAPMAFKVRYTLGEYIVFMWQHCSYLIRRRRIGRWNTFWMTLKSTLSAALHFVLQGRSRHLYDFTIDDHGIVRANGIGVTLVPWCDVHSIRRYSRGYMMVLKRGTLPIPYRCLEVGHAAAMEVYAVRLREAARLQVRTH